MPVFFVMHDQISMIIPILNNKLRQQRIPRAFARNKANWQNFKESSWGDTSEARNLQAAVDVKIGKWTSRGNLGEPGTSCCSDNSPAWPEGAMPRGAWAEGEGCNLLLCEAVDPTEWANEASWEPLLEVPLRAQEDEELDWRRLFTETLTPRAVKANSPKVSLGRGGRPWVEDFESDWTADKLLSGTLDVLKEDRADGCTQNPLHQTAEKEIASWIWP
jgi:hypothetical protein